MNIVIKKLDSSLLNDWLYYFDNVAFADNDEWAGCYCMCYHWTKELSKKKSWDCSKEDAPYNRKCAVRLIEKGIMQGYMAYHNDKVVGWCNANDKNAFDNVNFSLPESIGVERIKSVVCFNISPEFRRMGVASQLLERVCSDAKDDGYEYVEAYPFIHDENHAYHGPKSMYEKNGFVQCNKIEDCIVLRKSLI